MKNLILLFIFFTFCNSIDIMNNIDVDAVELLKWAGQKITDKVTYSEFKNSENERLVHALGEGTITACYFHKNKRHQITVIGGEGLPFQKANIKSNKEGRWACAQVASSLIGSNKYYYRVLN